MQQYMWSKATLFELSSARNRSRRSSREAKASGVGHTNLHAANGEWPVKPHLAFIRGHGAVGLVAGGAVRCLAKPALFRRDLMP